MKIYAPSYYKAFKCLADKCKNSCCIGWEIDIDARTAARYRDMEGALAEKLRRCIKADGETASFILDKNERCPFLSESGLCEIICELGEEGLCDICHRHPRFYNYLPDRIEVGLGISCEAAAELVLSAEEPFSLVEIGEEQKRGEASDYSPVRDRDAVIAELAEREKTLSERLAAIKAQYSVPTIRTRDEWLSVFAELECLDGEWRAILEHAMEDGSDSFRRIGDSDSLLAERLATYFVYRHLSSAVDEVDFRARLGFACLATELVFELYYSSGRPLSEIARRFSAEVEYSQENTQDIISEFDFYFNFEEE